jgi:hypothetical protein
LTISGLIRCSLECHYWLRWGLPVSLFKPAVLIGQELSIPHNPRNLDHLSSQPIHTILATNTIYPHNQSTPSSQPIHTILTTNPHHPRNQSINHPRVAPRTLREGFCPVWPTIPVSVPKLHVRHLFGLVRLRTWRFEGLLDRTIIIF